MTPTEHALFRSLVHGPLLVGDLPEAKTFPHRSLSIPARCDALNLQQKLGHLCENALAVLLEASPAFDLLACNLQIRRGGNVHPHTPTHTTVGELDFLLRDLSDGQLIHLELATKFYLAVPTRNGKENGNGNKLEFALPGPDARDNYFRKIQRLREHQLILTRKHREALPSSYRDENIVTRQLIYGCLFDPVPVSGSGLSMSSEDSPPREPALACPEFLNDRCRRGRWLCIDDCVGHFPAGTEFQIIPKALWPVPLEFLEGLPLERWTPQSPADHDRCVMLRVNDDITPYFVAPSGYPEQRAC